MRSFVSSMGLNISEKAGKWTESWGRDSGFTAEDAEVCAEGRRGSGESVSDLPPFAPFPPVKFFGSCSSFASTRRRWSKKNPHSLLRMALKRLSLVGEEQDRSDPSDGTDGTDGRDEIRRSNTPALPWLAAFATGASTPPATSCNFVGT